MKDTKPKWYLHPEWGIGIDPLNWKLYRACKPAKTSSKITWKVVGYYPTLEMLVRNLQEKMLLEDSDHTTLSGHVEAVLERMQASATTIKEIMDTIGVGPATLPPKYASYEVMR